MSWYDYDKERKLKTQLIHIKIHCMCWVSNRIVCFYYGLDDIEKLLLHHKSYFFNSIIYKPYGNSLEGRIKYYSSLINEVMVNPKNFLILCFKCHSMRHGKIERSEKL